jgi:hypothetical protein
MELTMRAPLFSSHRSGGSFKANSCSNVMVGGVPSLKLTDQEQTHIIGVDVYRRFN